MDFPQMETFELRGNTLGVEASAKIAEALESQRHLKVNLNFSWTAK